MGKFSVRFLSEGKDIHQEHYNRDWESAFDLWNRHGVYFMNKLKYEGKDFSLDFDVAQLGGSIDWEAASYPSEQVKQAVAAIIAFEPTRRALEKVKEMIGYCQFDKRYDLEKLSQEAISIIERAMPSPAATYIVDAKERYVSELKHTLGQEVRQVVGMTINSRTSQRSKDDALADAKHYLISRIDFFLHSATIYNAPKYDASKTAL